MALIVADPLIITIDGPSGSGKSTLARRLSQELQIIHLNSGSLYRALGIEAEKRGLLTSVDKAVEAQEAIDFDKKLVSISDSLSYRFEVDDAGRTHLLIGGRDITDLISSEHAGRLASQIATLPGVRSALTLIQRRSAEGTDGRKRSLVLEGRDAGTVVFPDANAKFFLEASPKVRAKRRHEELTRAGKFSGKIEDLERDMSERDHRDKTRTVAPHQKAEDAIVVNTSELSVEQVLGKILQLLCERHLITKNQVK